MEWALESDFDYHLTFTSMKSSCLNIAIICIVIASLTSCSKRDDLLNQKPALALVQPSSIKDYQSLLDNGLVNIAPGLGEMSSDDYYLTFTTWNAIVAQKEKNSFIWAPDIYQGVGAVTDWNQPYQTVLQTNLVLEGASAIRPDQSNLSEWNNLVGSALFLRSFAFFNLVSTFSLAYDSATASTDLGIPLKLDGNLNNTYQRSSVQQTYDQIIADVKTSVGLLPSMDFVTYRNRPSKVSAYSFLSRIYLSIRDYKNAGLYADSSLQLYNTLIDFNTISTTSGTPFTLLNNETTFQGTTITSNLLVAQSTLIDSTLFRSYSSNDLRKSIYFSTNTSGAAYRKSGYNAALLPFTGFATDEMYLNRAECFARAGNVTAALADLNTLLQKRWKTGTFTAVTATGPTDALNKILIERRKELIWRGLRWIDLRRLNKGGANISLARNLNGQLYSLPPNSPLYALPIPPDEIVLSGLVQNTR